MLVLAASGPRGALVCIRDTYPSLGFGGYHLQPADAVAAALNRGDDHEGVILCVVPAERSGVLRRQLASKSFDIRLWNNGSLDLAGG